MRPDPGLRKQGPYRDFQTKYREMEAASMTLLVHSKYMSGLLSRHALRSMNDDAANEDGQLGEVPRDLFLNIHPLIGAKRLESHQVLSRVLGSVFETIHACQRPVLHPHELNIDVADGLLTDAVSDSLELISDEPAADYWAADEDVWIKAEGQYLRKGVAVKDFIVEIGFCPSWQTHNNLFEELEEVMNQECLEVNCDDFDLEKLPLAYRFHVDSMGEQDQLDGIEFYQERQPVRLVSVGRVIVERYTLDVAQAVGQALCGDRAWIEDKNHTCLGLRVWAVDAWGRRSLVVLGGAEGGLLYVGQVDV